MHFLIILTTLFLVFWFGRYTYSKFYGWRKIEHRMQKEKPYRVMYHDHSHGPFMSGTLEECEYFIICMQESHLFIIESNT